MPKALVTGVGVWCPLGATVTEFTRNMFLGKSGIADHRGTLLSNSFPVTVAGIKANHIATGKTSRRLSLFFESIVEKDLTVLKEALSLVKNDVPFDGLIYCGHMNLHAEYLVELVKQVSINPEDDLDKITNIDYYADLVAEYLNNNGYGCVQRDQRICLSTACTTSTLGIGIAFENIRFGKWKKCLVIASDWRPLESSLMAFHALQALSVSKEDPTTISRPFDKTRSGLVRSYGGGAMVIESSDNKLKRDSIYAEISGFGCTTDAYRLTDGREDVFCLAKAMSCAISSASLTNDKIDYINAHGTSTQLNDRLETKAIKSVFGDLAYSLPVSSLKSQIGHSVVSAGIIETIASIIMLKNQLIAPTINYKTPDPECDLDYVPNISRKASLNHILKNSIAFAGHNTSLVISKYVK